MNVDSNFDMVRLTKAKKTVDLCSNTIREFSRQGLNLYRKGKCVFFSKTELAAFLRSKTEAR